MKSYSQMPTVIIGEISQILGIKEHQLSFNNFEGNEEVSVPNKIDLTKLREKLEYKN